jgi:signal transduction histidine kinase
MDRQTIQERGATDLAGRRRVFVDGLFFRIVACAFLEIVVVATALPSGLPLARFAPAIGVVALAAALIPIYWYVGKARAFPLRDFYVHWAVDLLTMSFLIHSLGGLDVPYGPFIYSMIVITSATFMSRSSSYLVAGGAALCLIVMGVGTQFGALPPPLRVWGHHFSWGTSLTVVVGAVIFFFMNAYLAGTLSDQLKRAKEEIEGHNRLLEQRVQERTRELQERTDELEELLHIVTHDLQNVAVASTETARKLIETDGAQLSERGRRYSERLVRDCRMMAGMLRDLLEAVTQAQVVHGRELVNVRAVVQEAVARAQTAIDGKGIEVTIGDLPSLHADRQKINHVFDNLLSNACKYVGDKPRPRVEITGTVHNGAIEYMVRDNGVGIEPNQISRIFQFYHRAPEQTVAGVVQQGHGIGLAVVKRIVQRFGGRMWVESVPGEGSSFYLSFPREERTEP